MRLYSAFANVIVLVVQVALCLLAFACFFGIAVVIYDQGAGRSGTAARAQVTAWDRFGEGALLGGLGVLCVAGVVKLSGLPRETPVDRRA